MAPRIPTGPINLGGPNPFGDLIQGRLAQNRDLAPEPTTGAPTPPELIFPELERSEGPTSGDRRQAKFQHVAEGLMAFAAMFQGKDVTLPGKAMAALRAKEEASEADNLRLTNLEKLQESRLRNEQKIAQFELDRQLFVEDRKNAAIISNALEIRRRLQKQDQEQGIAPNPAVDRFIQGQASRFSGEVEPPNVIRDEMSREIVGWDSLPKKEQDAAVNKAHETQKGIKFGFDEQAKTAAAAATGSGLSMKDATDALNTVFQREVDNVQEEIPLIAAKIERIERPAELSIAEKTTRLEEAEATNAIIETTIGTFLKTEAAAEKAEIATNDPLVKLADDLESGTISLEDIIERASKGGSLLGGPIEASKGFWDSVLFGHTDLLDRRIFRDKNGNLTKETIKEAIINFVGIKAEVDDLTSQIAGERDNLKAQIQPLIDEQTVRIRTPSAHFTTEAKSQVKLKIAQVPLEAAREELVKGFARMFPGEKPSPTRIFTASVADIRNGTAPTPTDPVELARFEVVKSAATGDGGVVIDNQLRTWIGDLRAAHASGQLNTLGKSIYADTVENAFLNGGNPVAIRAYMVALIDSLVEPGDASGETIVKEWETE